MAHWVKFSREYPDRCVVNERGKVSVWYIVRREECSMTLMNKKTKETRGYYGIEEIGPYEVRASRVW